VHSSVIGRFGGDEFCILLPEVGIKGAISTAERIRTMIEETTFRLQKEDRLINSRTTLSMGLVDIQTILNYQLRKSKDIKKIGFLSSYKKFMELREELNAAANSENSNLVKTNAEITKHRDKNAIKRELAVSAKVIFDNLDIVIDSFYECGDAAMYFSKRTGKNKASVFDPDKDYHIEKQEKDENNGDAEVKPNQ
jgi:GGDEF domain-containing protein